LTPVTLRKVVVLGDVIQVAADGVLAVSGYVGDLRAPGQLVDILDRRRAQLVRFRPRNPARDLHAGIDLRGTSLRRSRGCRGRRHAMRGSCRLMVTEPNRGGGGGL